MVEIMQRTKSAFKSITSNDEKQEQEITEKIEVKKAEINEYEGFANGFPEWSLEPPHIAVRRKR